MEKDINCNKVFFYVIKSFFIVLTIGLFCLPLGVFSELEKTPNNSKLSALFTNIKDSVSEIEGFTNEIFSTTRPIEDKQSLLSKIDLKVKQMLDLFEKSSPEEKMQLEKL